MPMVQIFFRTCISAGMCVVQKEVRICVVCGKAQAFVNQCLHLNSVIIISLDDYIFEILSVSCYHFPSIPTIHSSVLETLQVLHILDDKRDDGNVVIEVSTEIQGCFYVSCVL